jgi:predicted Zn-dependent protease
MSYVRAGEPGRALPVFKGLLDQNPRMTDVWELYSEALKEADRLPEALAAKKKMVELAPPGATHALLAVASLCLEMGLYDEALQNALLARQRGDLSADDILARAYDGKKDLPAAEAAARRAMEYGRTRKRAHLIMARIEVEKGSLANALELVDQAAVLYGSEGVPDGFHLLRGDILARMDRLPEAEVEMREEIRLHPRAVAPRISLALVIASRGRMAEARREVLETAATLPRLETFVKGVATLNYFGDHADAEALKRRGHALFPNDPRLK